MEEGKLVASEILARPLPATLQRVRDIQLPWIAPKTDGERKLLVLGGGCIKSIGMNNREQLLVSQDSDFQAQTLIDCELYQDRYYAFDVLIHEGVDVRMEPFCDRYERFKTVPFWDKIVVKKFFSPSRLNAEALLAHVAADGGVPSDGIVIVDAVGVYHAPCLKYKKYVTCDFLVKPTEGPWVWAKHGHRTVQFCTRPGKPDTLIEYAGESGIVECCNVGSGIWRPYRPRPDRQSANSVYSIRSNLHTMRHERKHPGWFIEALCSTGPPDMHSLRKSVHDAYEAHIAVSLSQKAKENLKYEGSLCIQWHSESENMWQEHIHATLVSDRQALPAEDAPIAFFSRSSLESALEKGTLYTTISDLRSYGIQYIACAASLDCLEPARAVFALVGYTEVSPSLSGEARSAREITGKCHINPIMMQW